MMVTQSCCSSSSSASAIAAAWPSCLSLSASRRPLLRLPSSFHSSSSTLQTPSSLRRTGNNGINNGSNTNGFVSKSPSAKYIREDYLVKKVSAKEVQELVKGKRSIPLIVDFYATWCGPCILMAQELEMLAVEYESNALFVKVDTDDEYEFARDMQVRGLPTLYFISPDPNKDAIRTEGLVPKEMIKNIIDNEM